MAPRERYILVMSRVAISSPRSSMEEAIEGVVRDEKNLAMEKIENGKYDTNTTSYTIPFIEENHHDL